MGWIRERIFNKGAKEKIVSEMMFFLYALILFYIYVNIKAYSIDEMTFFGTAKAIQFESIHDFFICQIILVMGNCIGGY